MHADTKVVLVTGSARRIGAAIVDYFHVNGYCVVVHYRHSKSDAQTHVEKLNKTRGNSAIALYADLDDPHHYDTLIQEAHTHWQRLDVLINNDSTFTPTPVETATLNHWDYLMNSNLKAPFFLSLKATPFLRKNQGNIINIVDIHAETPMKNYPIYSIAKAGLKMLTQSLALELAPDIRVNAVAPGNVLWPENENVYSTKKKENILARTLLKKQVSPLAIAETCYFLAHQEAITAQMISVDAGQCS